MTNDRQIKLQAFLDGELPESEAREMAAWIGRDPEAAGLLAELRHTRRAVAGFDDERKLPETREFFWSKIEREIDRLESNSPAEAAKSGWWHRFLVPLGAVAGLALVVMVAGLRFGLFPSGPVPETETATADAGTFTYHDYQNGTTLVWLSYPAER